MFSCVQEESAELSQTTLMFVPSPARARLWRIAQLAGVGLTLVLLADSCDRT
jgi:hypothetical protein